MSKTSKSVKLSATAKFAIVVAVIAVAILILAIVSNALSVSRAKESVGKLQALEKVTYTQEVKDIIDKAQKDYDEIGVNGLADSENFSSAFLRSVGGEELLKVITDAKKEYVRIAIKLAFSAHQRKYADGNSDEKIIELTLQARSIVDEYFKDNYDQVETYEDLLSLEEKYDAVATPPADENGGGNSSSGGGEDIELC